MKPITDKWQFALSLQRDWSRMESGWKVFTFGIFNFIRLPHGGATYGKDDYKGFIIKFRIWLPVEKY